MPSSRNGHISITGVSKYYGRHKALDDVSLEIPPGTVTVILGLPVRASPRCCAPLITSSALMKGLFRLMATISAIAAKATSCMR